MPSETLTISARLERRGDHPFKLEAELELPPGVTILFGPSGAGKSTVLGIIAGLTRPDHGHVRLGDEVWLDTERGIDLRPERRGVAYVFQSLALFPHLTALGNVEYGVSRNLDRGARRARAAAMLTKMRVAHLAERKPATFSGGEAQRVALARAFAMSPRVVLLDEPFSAFDHGLRTEFIDAVRTYVTEAQVPLVHVTHHRAEARALGDRVVLIRDGRITEVGTGVSLVPGGGEGGAIESTPT